MKPFWREISQPLADAETKSFDVIVVGSGYGGGVAASRLARAGQRVAVLERGREILPGAYPRDPKAMADEFQVTLSKTGKRLNPKTDCLFDLRVGDDVNVLVGCGLGGTSLINANVAVEPDPRVFDFFPKEYRKGRGAILQDHFGRAREMLGSNPYPKGKTPAKLAALEKIADGLGAPCKRLDINVTFKQGFNHAGEMQYPCTDCGDCVSGCNYGAKNTTLMNYLPDAAKHGAEIFTRAQVNSLRQLKTGWSLSVQDLATSEEVKLRAKIVVLAAGTLGTNEILMRSETNDLPFSKRLGKNFSGNGDIWALGYNANIPVGEEGRAPIYGAGAGVHDVEHGPPKGDERYRPGPCITGMIDLRDENAPLERGVMIEEGVFPGALAAGYAVGFPMFNALTGDLFRFGDADKRAGDAKEMATKMKDAPLEFVEHVVYEGTVSRTLPFLVMSHDSSSGTLEMDKGHLVVDWKGAGREDAIRYDNALLQKACDIIQAEFMPMPFSQPALNDRLLTVHPLGGCAMGDTVKKGVINYKCQVFDPKGDIYDGLYVCDGAAMPRGLGSNPHLTITAVAEFAMEELIKEKGWRLDLAPGTPPPVTVPPPKEVDYVDALEKAIAGLKAIESAIDAKVFELAQQLLKGLARQLEEFTPKTFWKKLEDESNLEAVTAPIIEILLDALEPMAKALKAKKYMDLLSIAESKLGDFSPAVSFHERMTGRVSDVGLNDPDPLFDAYEAAGFGTEDNLSFEATISSDSVLAALTPENRMTFGNDAILVWNTTLAKIEGTFGLFHPKEDEIEQWRMYYDGTFKQGGKTLKLEGFKILQHREGSHWWRDLNELSVDIKDGDNTIARGKLHVGLESVLDQANGLKVEFGDLSDVAKEVYKTLSSTKADGLLGEFKKSKFRAKMVKAALLAVSRKMPEIGAIKAVEEVYRTKTLARFGELVLRTYGGVFSYMANFPALECEYGPALFAEPDYYYPEVEPGVYLKLTRYRGMGADKGPVILAGGFGTKASSLATPTIDKSIAEVLWKAGYDVWLFDYRGSGDIEASLQPFTIDDVATKDWPAAIDLITAVTAAEDVQALVHCVGSMSLFMAVLAGENRVRSIIASQLGPHAIGNWLKYVQADSPLADWLAHGFPDGIVDMLDGKVDDEILRLAKDGMTFVEPRSPSVPPQDKLDPIIDGLLWQTPSFQPVPCTSPTCHRINFFFGPSFRHEQLNQATHNAIREMFGAVSSTPFLHLSEIFKAGKAHSRDGSIDYFRHPERLSMPIHFIAGAKNQEMLPEATLRTLTWLKDANKKGAGPYTRHVYQDYGHMDCFIGKTASKDIFPDLLKVLDEHAKLTAKPRKKRKG